MIEQKIKEVGEYFKNKVINGDYEFVGLKEHYAIVKIDNKYTFNLWTANEIKTNFDFYFFNMGIDTPFLRYIKLTTQKERLDAYKKMKPFIEAYKKHIILKEKTKKFNDLKKELKL